MSKRNDSDTCENCRYVSILTRDLGVCNHQAREDERTHLGWGDCPDHERAPKKGFFLKYSIERNDGKPMRRGVRFLLNFSSDRAARSAGYAYAKACREENPTLADDLVRMLSEIEEALGEKHCG